MKSILLIGGEGYIGNIISKKFLDLDYEVTSYDKLVYDNYHCVFNKFYSRNYTFVYGDMADANTLKPLIKNSDIVVLLAGLVGDPITKQYPIESEAINIRGVQNVINICANENTERFIFISTCSNYGLIDENEMADENHILNPLSLYSKAKVNAEKYILSLVDKTDMNPTILRFATAFGLSPRMRFDLTISEFALYLAMGQELNVYDANTWRPYCHVEDFANLIQLAINAPLEKISFEVFNAGGDINNATKQMIIDLLIEKMPNSKVNYQEKGTDPRNYRVSFKKVKSVLGFEPSFTISD